MKLILLLLAIVISASSDVQKRQDTVATAKKPNYYILIGDEKSWNLLFTAVTSPQDVTPRQVEQLASWMKSGLKKLDADSANNGKLKKSNQ